MPDAARSWRLAVLAPVPPDVLTGLVAGLPVEVAPPPSPGDGGVRAALSGAELVLADWTAGARLPADVAALAPDLAFVQQPSVGVPAEDPGVLAKAGVPLANAAGFNTAAVAEWVLGAAISVARSLSWADAQVRGGAWPAQFTALQRGPVELSGRRVGIVGFGPIGAACAVSFAALGCPVSYWSRSRRAPSAEHGATFRELDTLVATSDVLVNAIALAPQTRGLLGPERIARLPAGAIVVSASRGEIVDERAVATQVAAGHLTGAAFDVYDTEPLAADSPLRGSDRILLTPHLAGSTAQSAGRLLAAVVANLRRATSGEPVENVVNGVDPVVRRRR